MFQFIKMLNKPKVIIELIKHYMVDIGNYHNKIF